MEGIMKRLLLLTVFFIFLDSILFAQTYADDIWYQQMQEQQAQQAPQGGGFGGDFTRITVTQPSYYSQPSNYRPASDSGSKNKTDSWGTSSNSTQADYTAQRPADYGLLRDTGTSPGFSGPAPQTNQPASNGLWIVDSTGLKRYPSFSLPIDGYIEEELTPGMEGNLTIEELYPNGQLHTFSMGYVQPFHVYKMWFTADIPGTHKVRYNVDGYYSNIIDLYVKENSVQSDSNQAYSSTSNEDETKNPAIAFCIARGNIYENGKCTFPGGSSCDIWDFYRGDCILIGKPRR
jgi:putative hemolysin